jgi:two-component system cell cycle sensor histidine kinase/response regulator CckA
MGKKLNVLIVEDSESDHELVMRALKKGGFDVTSERVDSPEALLDAIQNRAWDAIISDYTLPAFDGMQALELVKKAGSDLPFIVVSGRDDIVRNMMKAGAHDYIHKSSLAELPPIVERELGEAEQRRLRRLAEVKLAETQKQLHVQDELLRLILNSTAEAIFGVDLNGNCTMANPASARMLGYASPDDLMGKHIHSLIHHHRADGSAYSEEECLINKPFRTGIGTHVKDEVFWRADGTKFEVEYFSSPIRHEGKLIGAVATFVDVSEQRELEARLLQSQKMDAIGKLAGGVAHDFNNILAVILMQAGLVQNLDGVSTEVREAVDGIGNAAERAAHLTRQLLLFSRQEAMEMRNCELNGIVQSLAKMLERLISEDVHIQVKWSAQRLLVYADPGMIDQVLMNLVVNARDAMPKGGEIIIETSAKELDPLMAAQMPHGRPGSFVCVSVTDTGCGIPPENVPHIFEPFFTTKKPEKGTGLGLSTVFGIVQEHSGWIHVETCVGTGTSFRVFLPRLSDTTVVTPDSPASTTRLRGNETILLVEDDSAVSNSVRSILEQLGYRVLSAETGTEAMEVWNVHRKEIKLLLTDLIMPDEMSGEELAVQLRREKPDLKIIYTSGYSKDSRQTSHSLQEGINFLPKPYSPQKLSEILRRNLD